MPNVLFWQRVIWEHTYNTYIRRSFVIDDRNVCGTLQTRVTFELYYHCKGDEPETFYVDENADEDRRLLVDTADREIYTSTPNASSDDAKRYVAAAAARYSTSSTRP